MDSKPTLLRKRPVEEEEDEIDDTPKLADEKTLAQRRMVRVKRSEAPSAPSFKDAFKSLPSVSPSGAPSLSTAFQSSSSLSAPTTSSFSFNFGTQAPQGGAAPTASFSFGAKQTTEGGASATPAFSFGSKTTTGGEAPKFSFGAPAFTNSGSNGSSTTPVSFDFGNAVNSFVAAKKKLEEQRAAEDPDKSDSADDKNNDEAPETETSAFANASPVLPSTGDVLASISSKLYTFKPDTKTWAECGSGDAKVKRHELTGEGEGAEKHFVYRLIVRDGYSLNAPFNSNFHLSKLENTHAIFTIPSGDKVVTYLLKYTGQNASENGLLFSKTLKETLQLAFDQKPNDKTQV